MLIADAATILCLFFGLLSVFIIFFSFSGLSQTPDPFLNPTTQSKSSFSAVETILFPTAVIHASLKHGMFSFSDDHFVYNGRSGIWWTFFSQCSIWHNMVPKMQKIGTSLHFYLRSDTHFAAQMSQGLNVCQGQTETQHQKHWERNHIQTFTPPLINVFESVFPKVTCTNKAALAFHPSLFWGSI